MIILEDIFGACLCLQESCPAVVASSTAAPSSSNHCGTTDDCKDEAAVA